MNTEKTRERMNDKRAISNCDILDRCPESVYNCAECRRMASQENDENKDECE